MSLLRPWKIRLFALIGRPRCDACGDHRATTTRTVGPLAWLVCGGCDDWIDAGFAQDEPLKARRFEYASGYGRATVACHHCDWITSGGVYRHGDDQAIFDRSSDHECDGVESYAAMLAQQEATR